MYDIQVKQKPQKIPKWQPTCLRPSKGDFLQMPHSKMLDGLRTAVECHTGLTEVGYNEVLQPRRRFTRLTDQFIADSFHGVVLINDISGKVKLVELSNPQIHLHSLLIFSSLQQHPLNVRQYGSSKTDRLCNPYAPWSCHSCQPCRNHRSSTIDSKTIWFRSSFCGLHQLKQWL